MQILPYTAALVACLTFSAYAEQPASPNDPRADIKQRVEEINKYAALLTTNDSATRLAALDTLLHASDSTLRELAYRIAFESNDETMRAIALKRKVGDLKTIVIDVEANVNATQDEKNILAAWGGTYAFEIESFDEKSGTFESTDYNHKGKGQVTGTNLSFSHPFCNGTFSLGDGGVLTGILGCRGKWQGKFTGTAKID